MGERSKEHTSRGTGQVCSSNKDPKSRWLNHNRTFSVSCCMATGAAWGAVLPPDFRGAGSGLLHCGEARGLWGRENEADPSHTGFKATLELTVHGRFLHTVGQRGSHGHTGLQTNRKVQPTMCLEQGGNLRTGVVSTIWEKKFF